MASRIGSLHEIIEERKTGLKFKSGDSNNLAKKVNMILEKPTILSEMSRYARATYEKRYNPESNLKMLLDIYRQVIPDVVSDE